MKGAQSHARRRAAQKMLHPLTHFPGGFVGEGDGQNFTGMGMAGGDQMGNAGGEHTGFPGAGASEHQNRPQKA